MRSPVRTLVPPGIVAFLLMVAPANAAYVITVTQSGGNVVVSGSGTLNLTALTVATTGSCGGGHMGPSTGQLEVGQFMNTPCTEYNISGPASFGGGGYSVPNSGTGLMVGVFESELVTDSSYVSGTQTSGTATWNSATFASLGLTPGTYVYTWGSGVNADSLTVQIGTGPAPTPAPGSLTLIGIGVAALLVWCWFARNRSVAAPQ
jgi:hypothetical protein